METKSDWGIGKDGEGAVHSELDFHTRKQQGWSGTLSRVCLTVDPTVDPTVLL